MVKNVELFKVWFLYTYRNVVHPLATSVNQFKHTVPLLLSDNILQMLANFDAVHQFTELRTARTNKTNKQLLKL